MFLKSLLWVIVILFIGTQIAHADWISKRIRYDGVRTYELWPANGDVLAIVLHGGGGKGKSICRKVALEDVRPDWIIACPDGIDGKWNDLEEVDQPDDVGFLSKLITRLSRKYTPSQIIIIGHSLGGMMAQTLACRNSNSLDSLVLSGTTFRVSDCDVALPVLHMHSIAWTYEGAIGDKRIPFTCPDDVETCRMQDTSPGRVYPPALSGVEGWAERGGCVGVDTLEDDGAVFMKWQDCREPVQAVGTDGCHGWPGAKVTWRDRLKNCIPPTFSGTRYLAQWIEE